MEVANDQDPANRYLQSAEMSNTKLKSDVYGKVAPPWGTSRKITNNDLIRDVVSMGALTTRSEAVIAMSPSR